MNICAGPLVFAREALAILDAQKREEDHANVVATACGGCGKLLEAHQRQCENCGRPTRL